MKKIIFLFSISLLTFPSFSQPPRFNGQETKNHLITMDQYGYINLNHKKFFGSKEQFLAMFDSSTIRVKQPIQGNLVNIVGKDICTTDTAFGDIELVSTFKMKPSGSWRMEKNSSTRILKKIFADETVTNKIAVVNANPHPEDIVKNQ